MTASASLPHPRRLRFPAAGLAAVAVWLGLAVVAGATGFLTRLPFPGPELISAALFAATLAAGTAVPALRAWIDALPLRVLIGINAFRLIGIIFLVLAAQGQIAPILANRAGWGDIATAALAIILVAAGEPRTPARRALVHAWNAFGLLDLVIAVGTVAWVTLHSITPGIGPLFGLPIALVPMFFVPIFLANHVFIFGRLVAAGRSPAGGR